MKKVCLLLTFLLLLSSLCSCTKKAEPTKQTESATTEEATTKEESNRTEDTTQPQETTAETEPKVWEKVPLNLPMNGNKVVGSPADYDIPMHVENMDFTLKEYFTDAEKNKNIWTQLYNLYSQRFSEYNQNSFSMNDTGARMCFVFPSEDGYGIKPFDLAFITVGISVGNYETQKMINISKQLDLNIAGISLEDSSADIMQVFGEQEIIPGEKFDVIAVDFENTGSILFHLVDDQVWLIQISLSY